MAQACSTQGWSTLTFLADQDNFDDADSFYHVGCNFVVRGFGRRVENQNQCLPELPYLLKSFPLRFFEETKLKSFSVWMRIRIGLPWIHSDLELAKDPVFASRAVTRLPNYHYFLLQFWYEAKNDEGHSYYWNVNTKGKTHFYL